MKYEVRPKAPNLQTGEGKLIIVLNPKIQLYKNINFFSKYLLFSHEADIKSAAAYTKNCPETPMLQWSTDDERNKTERRV